MGLRLPQAAHQSPSSSLLTGSVLFGRFAVIDALSVGQTAKLLGVTARTVTRWRAQGMPGHADGTYSGPAVFAWALKRLGNDLNYQRTRLCRAQADRTALQVMQQLRVLTLSEDVWQPVESMISTVRTRLLAIPDVVASRTSSQPLAELVRAELYAALTDLSTPPMSAPDIATMGSLRWCYCERGRNYQRICSRPEYHSHGKEPV